MRAEKGREKSKFFKIFLRVPKSAQRGGVSLTSYMDSMEGSGAAGYPAMAAQ